MIVLDTCALLWRAFSPDSLSTAAAKSIEKADSILVSSISFWEIGIKIKNKKLEIPISIDQFVEQTKKVSNLEIVSIDESLWLESLKLDWKHRDPADRVIVATAKMNHSSLITNDQEISSFYSKTIW